MLQLSIIIAAYNVELFIEKCILSCVSEQYQDKIEILVVDDGSTDTTFEKIMDLKEKVKSITVISQENQGLGASRNIGIKNAKGKYIWMIDGDDYIESNSLITILEDFKKNIDVYSVNFNVCEENGEILYKAYQYNDINTTLTGSEYYKFNYDKNYTWQYIFRKDLFLEHNIAFRERINMQDSEILPRILYHVKSVKYLNLVAYNYVQYKNSFTNTQNPIKRYKYFESIIEVRNSLQNFGEIIKTKNSELYIGIQNKLESLDQVVFNHLVFYRYKNEDFVRNIELLKNANFFPIKVNTTGKMKFVKWAINRFPALTNYFLNLIKK